jgi:hypothetical protein
MFTPYSISIDDNDWTEIECRFSHAWPWICNAAREYIHEYRRRRPDRIRLYIRPDCGTVFFAFDSGKSYYAEIASIVIRRLENDYFSSPVTEEQHVALIARVERAIEVSARDAMALAAIRALVEEFGLFFVIVEYDDLEMERGVLLALGET